MPIKNVQNQTHLCMTVQLILCCIDIGKQVWRLVYMKLSFSVGPKIAWKRCFQKVAIDIKLKDLNKMHFLKCVHALKRENVCIEKA